MDPPNAEISYDFDAAPWPTALKVVSLIAAVFLCFASYAIYHRIPKATGWGHSIGLAVAALPLLGIIAGAFFVVRGYTVGADGLSVRRLVTFTRVPLAGLRRVWSDRKVCTNSMRVFGNGGMFAYCGWFYNGRLGFFRAFATDLSNAVMLEFPERVVVVSPSSPPALIEHLQRLFPGLRVGGEART